MRFNPIYTYSGDMDTFVLYLSYLSLNIYTDCFHFNYIFLLLDITPPTPFPDKDRRAEVCCLILIFAAELSDTMDYFVLY